MFWPHAFSCAWRQLHVFASNSDWLVVLFTSVAIGQSNYFGFGFTTLNKNCSNMKKDKIYYMNGQLKGFLQKGSMLLFWGNFVAVSFRRISLNLYIRTCFDINCSVIFFAFFDPVFLGMEAKNSEKITE